MHFDKTWYIWVYLLVIQRKVLQVKSCLHYPNAHLMDTGHDNVIKWKHFPALLALCAGNSPVAGEFPLQRPVTRSFDVCFYLSLNKRLCKQSLGWWFEMPSHSLWRHRNVCNITGHNDIIIYASYQKTISAGPYMCTIFYIVHMYFINFTYLIDIQVAIQCENRCITFKIRTSYNL